MLTAEQTVDGCAGHRTIMGLPDMKESEPAVL
jgi:hypothetical protein